MLIWFRLIILTITIQRIFLPSWFTHYIWNQSFLNNWTEFLVLTLFGLKEVYSTVFLYQHGFWFKQRIHCIRRDVFIHFQNSDVSNVYHVFFKTWGMTVSIRWTLLTAEPKGVFPSEYQIGHSGREIRDTDIKSAGFSLYPSKPQFKVAEKEDFETRQ